MDTGQRLYTPATYTLMRLEHVLVVVVCALLVLRHIDTLDWWRFIAVFLIIDLVGYLPGAIAFRRRRGAVIPPVYHYLYNIMHAYLTWAVIVTAWTFAVGGFEWAMLAIPIHLSGDRGLFGNLFKSVTLPFEATRRTPGEALTGETSRPGSAGGIQ